jgi:YidC/Oxa1 family membrane protein insertase
VEQRRLLIACVLSLFIIIAYRELVLSRYPHDEESAPPPTTASEPRAADEPTPPAPTGDLAATVDETGAVTVDTDVLHAVITPVGARLVHLQLKAFRRTVEPDSEPLDIVEPGGVLPGTLQIGPKGSDAGFRYRTDRTEVTVHGVGKAEVTFSTDSPTGAHIEKRYGFSGDGYVLDLAVNTTGEHPSSLGLILSPVQAETQRGTPTAIAFANRKFIEKPVLGLEKQPIPVDDAVWAGFAAQYFLAAAIPENGGGSALMTVSDGTPIVRMDAPLVDGRASFAVYAGPKERETLTRAGHELDRALDFGWFWFVAIPLLYALRMLHSVTGNYGISIIVLTAAVKVLTAPLTRTTFRNMREMQKIQPQMAKLRERFKDDQVALQKEMMELYRRHRVNPFSGCLPMILQLPIFVGLYNTLYHAIELRHAPFFLWINDLSAPDRLTIAGLGVPVLTLLMGGSMFLQQWLTPQQGDPTQQRMMMFMPLIFTYMFIHFPAGLVLYWLVNNVLTIGQQYLMMRSMK